MLYNRDILYWRVLYNGINNQVVCVKKIKRDEGWAIRNRPGETSDKATVWLECTWECILVCWWENLSHWHCYAI